jgi:serine/threonine protein kinase
MGMTAADHDRLLGVTLEGRYQLLKLLGKGGMGRVYLAEERLLRRHCAVKLLPREHTENATNVERFLREAQVIARVRHENIVEIYSFGQDPDGEVFYVMELLSGEDLEARLKDPARGLPDWHELCAWGVQICRALAAVHDAGFVHRDLKPGNLFLTRRSDGSALIKLLDFGIARPAESQLTGTGALLGTVAYMSPEQVQALPLDGRSDIYALGILLYRAIAGRPPFRGDPVQVIQQHVHAPPPALLPLAQGRSLPVALLDLIDRCLRKSCEERFQSMREVEAVLSALLAEQSPRLADSVAPTPPSLRADPVAPAPPSPLDDSTASRPSLVDSVAPASPPPSASPAELSTNVYAAPRPAVLDADVAASNSEPAPHEPTSSTDECMSLPTLEPDDSLVDPHHRFRAPTPEGPPPAVPQHVAMCAPVVEEAPAPPLPTSAHDPQPSTSRRTDRRLPILGLAAVSLLVLLFVLRPQQSEREPDPPTPRASVSRPAPIPSAPARVVSSIPASTPMASPADPRPADELPGEAAQPSKPADDPLVGTPPELPPMGTSASSPKATSPEHPKIPWSLYVKSKRCRRENDAVNLPPIVLDYSLVDRKVVEPQTLTEVAPALAACLEAALQSTTFAGDDFGIGKRISL